MEPLKFRVDACLQVGKTLKVGNEQEDCLRQGHRM
jgi:hypothetical protein